MPEHNAKDFDVGDEVEVILLKYRKEKYIKKGFGMAKNFLKSFKRDKKTRDL